MAGVLRDKYKFPNGYDVEVCRNEDILSELSCDDFTKEVTATLIDKLETDVVAYMKLGKWVGIPFIGNLKASDVKRLEKEKKDLIDEARDTLSREDYILFRKNLTKDIYDNLKADRYFKYVLSMAVKSNHKSFNRVAKRKGTAFARLLYYCSYYLKYIPNEQEPVDR